MRKKFFITAVMMCCFTMYLTGCFLNKSADSAVTSPTYTEPPNSISQAPNTTPPTQNAISTPTMPPNSAMQTPGSTLAIQTNQSESTPTITIDTGLPDGTKVKLFVSGREFAEHWVVIISGEALVPDYTYVFGNLKDAGGIENAGFWAMGSLFTNENIENVVISNSPNFLDTSQNIENGWYTIEIVEGEYSFLCNDETIPLIVPAQTINGLLHVPLIALADAINATIEWDAAAQAIMFFYK